MEIRLSLETLQTMRSWKRSITEQMQCCINRYNRNPWKLKRKRGKSEPQKVKRLYGVDGLEPWQIRAIIEDAVEAGKVEDAKWKKPEEFKPPMKDLEELNKIPPRQYVGNHEYDHRALGYELETLDG